LAQVIRTAAGIKARAARLRRARRKSLIAREKPLDENPAIEAVS